MNTIYMRDIETLYCCLPPLEEQRRIAAILDKADKVENEAGKIQEMRDEIIRATFLDMFGDPVTNPLGFHRCALAEVASIRGRVGWRGYKKTDLVETGHLVVGGENITSLGDLDFSKHRKHLGKEKYEESPEIQLKTNDLIFVQRGSLGKVAIVSKDVMNATINPCVQLIRPGNLLVSVYLLYFFLHPSVQTQIKLLDRSSSQPMITQSQMKLFPIILPPIELQNQFADIVQQINDLDLSALETQATTLKQSLTQELLA